MNVVVVIGYLRTLKSYQDQGGGDDRKVRCFYKLIKNDTNEKYYFNSQFINFRML